jgi:hypothetical protein
MKEENKKPEGEGKALRVLERISSLLKTIADILFTFWKVF